MKHKIKKNRLKIFIALSLMITCVFGVMFATNTFAYETDKMSYTITEIGNTNSNYQTITNTTSYIDITYGNENALYFKNQNGFSYKQYYILINFTYLNQGNINQVNISSRLIVTPFYFNNNNEQRQAQNVSINTYSYNYNSTKNYYTLCIPIILSTNYNETMKYFKISNWFYLGSTNANTISIYDYRIYNIDLVTSEDLGLSQYYDTYYSNIENQYNQLLEDYNTLNDNYDTLNDNYTQLENDYNDLQDNYDTLNDNYTQLENDYNDLQDNYDNLETNYEDLDNKLKNLYFNTNYGIWDFLAYEEVAIFEPNYSSTDEYYRYEGITNWVKYNNVLEMNKLNITNAITRYWSSTNTPPYTINCDSWVISMYFSVPNNVSYIYYEMPLDVLDLFIDTNISFNNIVPNENVNDYLAIDIRLSNYDNYSYANFIDLDISRDFLDQYGFKITKENLQQYFSQYDLNYYNNIMSITIGSNYKLSTTDKFNIISSNAVIDRNYQLGFIDGQASMDNTIRGLKVQISDLNGTISQLQLVIDTLNGQVDTLTNGYDLNNLMWTIGSVPFESFKQIWNVNFFGVNLADFFLGFVTFFVALFVVKKFFL